ncbi:MAG: aminotransferase class I/II-fold pyridoxal phosphate-dependent enzyme [Puniceicoccales bacterium]|nr:aminotransferase class I/II-fold pyridoxal phosphate-dependent enzyme [Puniceicoccales bacterium]
MIAPIEGGSNEASDILCDRGNMLKQKEIKIKGDEEPKLRVRSEVIHGAPLKDQYDSIVMPVYRTTIFGFKSSEELFEREANVVSGKRDDEFTYMRVGSPTNDALERRLAKLESAESCVVTASGMGAISTVMWTFLKQGDHVLADTTLYSGTRVLLGELLTKFGVEVDFVDFNDLGLLRKSLKPNTVIVFFESPYNPVLKINDIAQIAKIVHSYKKDIRMVFDNTFATPYLQNPLLLGADIVVHSITKYIGGHSDVMAGCVLGSKEDMRKIRFTGVENATGAVMSPDNAYLALRGLCTLPIRMDQQCKNAMKIAQYLEKSPHISKVYYPGLESFPGHETAKKQMRDFGGIVSFEVKTSPEQMKRFVNGLKLIKIAGSLGGVETVIEHPVSMSHSSYTPEQLAESGITLNQFRLSVGIEDVRDLIDDLEKSFENSVSRQVSIRGKKLIK